MLLGQAAVVTGAGRGIGRAIAVALARAGAHVVLAARTVLELEAAAEEIGALGRRALVVKTDVTNRVLVDELVTRTVEAFGRLDILVNNAAVSWTQPLLEITEEDWDRIFDVNAKGVLWGIQAAARVMGPQGGGSIVNIASLAGRAPRPAFATYAASKAAVISLTRSAAVVLGAHNIRVNAVCPGPIATGQQQNDAARRVRLVEEGRLAPEHVNYVRSAVLARPGTTEDVAEVVLFLAGPASTHITGQSVNVCGGREFD